jgi:FkbM family methyltransferase
MDEGGWYKVGIRNRLKKSLLWRILPDQGLFVFDTGDLKIATFWPDLLAQALYINQVYHPQTVRVMEKHIVSEDICVDVGANVGYLTCIMARKARQVYAFEPHNQMRALLKYNLRLNNITNVVVRPEALLEKKGKVRFFENMEPMYSGVVGNVGMSRIRWSNCTTLDKAVPQATFVKIDVEGAEHRVLKGMTEILKKPFLRMVIEVEPDRIGFSEEVYDFLEGWKFINVDLLNLFCWKLKELKEIDLWKQLFSTEF